MATTIAPCPYCSTKLELTFARKDECPRCRTKFYFTQSKNFQKVEKLPIIRKQKIIGYSVLPLLLIGTYLRSEDLNIFGGAICFSDGLLLIWSFSISNHCISKYGFFDPFYFYSGSGDWAGPYLKKDKYFSLHLSTLYLELFAGIMFMVIPFISFD